MLWSIKPSELNRIALKFLETDLPFDRHEFITRHLYQATQHLAYGGKHFASLYLLAHGLIKALLVAALWFDALWAYPAHHGCVRAFLRVSGASIPAHPFRDAAPDHRV